MKHLIQKTDKKPNCLLYSAAMILETTPKKLREVIGHDGFKVVWSELKDIRKYCGYHIQEIIDAAYNFGYVLSPIELSPQAAPWDRGDLQRDIWSSEYEDSRFFQWIKDRPGILIVQENIGHAVAWTGEEILDPEGFRGDIDNYSIREAWLRFKLV